MTFDRNASDLVLIVDDQPDNLAMLHDALDESGYTVLVATNGESALARAAQARPDIVLLDAVMPGIDGFEVARRLKADAQTVAIPIVFMTGLTDTEHVLAAFAAGGVDYVTKPIRPREVLARLAAHVHTARQANQAHQALDAFGHATLVVRAGDGRLVWQTALARQMLQQWFGGDSPWAPPPLLDWVRAQVAQGSFGSGATGSIVQAARRLHFTLHESTGDDEWLIVLREANDAAMLEAMMLAFKLTAREAEVLYWVVKGKTNRDVGDILGASAATVKKHLERVYEKLGVETRTAAASLAIQRVRQLGP